MKKQPESEAASCADDMLAGIREISGWITFLQISTRHRYDDMLAGIREISDAVGLLAGEYNLALADLTERYEVRLNPLRADLAADEKALISLMKKEKQILFADGIGTVRLENGSLIYNKTDKVSIPHGALAVCESQGFSEVIKIAKSLDRDAIEKWPDEKLCLIGAERKPKEEFSYDLKRS
jgi:phage host-nuclease inhibitor protein Gam